MLGEVDRVSRLKKLSELSLTRFGDPVEVFRHITSMIGELLDVSVVCLSEVRGDELYFTSVCIDGEVMTDAGQCKIDNTPCATVQASKDICIYDHVIECFPEASFLKTYNAYSYCGIPSVDHNGHVVAITCLLDDKPHRFTEEDKDLLRIFGQRIAIEFERKRATENHIASEKTLEESGHEKEHQLSMILDTADEAIVTIDENQKILYFNHGAEKTFGYTADEVIGRSIDLLLPESSRQLHYKLIQDFAVSSTQSKTMDERVEIGALRKDGTVFPAEASISKVETRGGILLTAILRDNTERMRVQMALKQAHDELEQRVQERTEQLIRAKEAADKANLAKSEFLSNMSHELRTPLNAILGFGQLLTLDEEYPLHESQQNSVRKILDAGKHLLELINEVLDLARIESGKVSLTLEPIDASFVIDETLLLIEPIADSRGIRIIDNREKNVNLVVQGNSRSLKEILLNLMSNAVKYNEDQGTITISAEKTQDEMLRLSIIDTGNGLSEEQQKKLFQPFSRVGGNEQIEGTGIGLTISRQLAELMNGKIGMKSRVGYGTTFWLELPLSQEQVTAPDVRVPVSVKADEIRKIKNNIKVLVAEDDRSNQLVIEAMLKITGYVVDLASDGEQALALWETNTYDLILMDIRMPKMDGLLTSRLIREGESKLKLPRIPIIALTANVMNDGRETCLAAGMDDFLEKPVLLEQLNTMLRSHLSGANTVQ